MRKVLFAVLVAVFVVGGGTWPVFAETVTTSKPLSYHGKHTVTVHDATVDTDTHRALQEENYEKHDYGAFLDLLYAINNNVDVGVKTTYEHKRNEYTALVGAVVKFGPGVKK